LILGRSARTAASVCIPVIGFNSGRRAMNTSSRSVLCLPANRQYRVHRRASYGSPEPDGRADVEKTNARSAKPHLSQ
jgi:hypothetical protein